MQRVLEPEVMDTEQETLAYDAMDHLEANTAFVNRLLELGVRKQVLDIGTGPGHIPLLLCQNHPSCSVVGVDLSAHMLRFARRHLAASPHAARVDFELGDAKNLAFPAHSFEVVCSNTILHHIPDPTPFLAEAWRVLKPGGTFLVRDLFRPDSVKQVLELVKTHAGSETSEARELFRASLCAALTPDELRVCAAAAGLTGVEVVVDTDRHMSLQCGSATER
jgi:ubiquinone/menaquinone biosynthesis C-methylase UbiE